MVLYRNQPATIQDANETLRDTLKILKLKSAMLIFFCLTRQFPTYGSSPNIFINVMASTTIVAQASIFASDCSLSCLDQVHMYSMAINWKGCGLSVEDYFCEKNKT